MRDTIFNSILTKLQEISMFSSKGQIRVYSYEKSDWDGYPACSLTNLNTESEILDNSRDKRIYHFNIRVVQERLPQPTSTQGPAEAEKIMRQLEDTIFSMFDNDNDLGLTGQVIRTRPISTTWGYLQNNTIRVFDIIIAVEAVATITI